MTLNQPRHEPTIKPEELDPTVRFAADPITARRTPRQKARPATKEQVEERLAFARARMLAGATDGDIKRAMVRKYGIKGQSCCKYISLARRRIREYIEISPDNSAAAALAHYAKNVMEFDVPCQMVMGRLVSAQKRLGGIDERLSDPSIGRDERSGLDDAREAVVREIDTLWRDYLKFKSIIDSSRKMIVDLTGAAAPTKVALTTAGGDDVLRAAEPATPAAAEAEIAKLLALTLNGATEPTTLPTE